FVLTFDSTYFVAGMASENIPAINKKIGDLFDAQRIKRANMYTMGMTYVFTAVDMGLVSKYLHEFEGAKRGREITNEIFGWLPNLCCALHGDGKKGKSNKYMLLALGGIDIVSTAVTTGLSVRILKDDLKELSAG
ncbi:MAG: hypothetical protein SAK29_40600, partial [Scytonema sp. PMC 1069.18]|nr:hypothetical protein [Scytonema sp. PMC 1069.18]